MIDLRKSQALITIAVTIVGSLVFVSSCSHQRIVQVGSHKVTISRHGLEKKIHFNPDASVPSFEYKGIGVTGRHFKVTITGDKVRVNDLDYGELRSGDSVLIGDDGVAVNSMDYGESEKYLRANNPGLETIVTKHDR